MSSPNQEHKRAQIVDAARIVLARDGLAACTVRAVSDAGPLTKSAVHYYFDDIDEIVDAAVAAHVAATVAELHRVAAEEHPSPERRLRAVVETYLGTFADKPHAAFLWFEYWIARGRRGSTARVEAMLDDVRVLLADLLAALLVEDPAAAACTVLAWLLGTIVTQHVHARPAVEIDAEVTTLLRAFRPHR